MIILVKIIPHTSTKLFDSHRLVLYLRMLAHTNLTLPRNRFQFVLARQVVQSADAGVKRCRELISTPKSHWHWYRNFRFSPCEQAFVTYVDSSLNWSLVDKICVATLKQNKAREHTRSFKSITQAIGGLKLRTPGPIAATWQDGCYYSLFKTFPRWGIVLYAQNIFVNITWIIIYSSTTRATCAKF